MSFVGLGVSKGGIPSKIFFNSVFASLVVPTSFPNQIDSGARPSTDDRYILRIILVSSLLKIISPVRIFSSTVSLLHLHPLAGGDIRFPDGDIMSYIRLGR